MSASSRVRWGIKKLFQMLSVIIAAPFALLAGFGRFEFIFQLFAQASALLPGIVGDYLRVGYYALTLDRCSLDSRVSFGSFFAQSSSRVARGVYIGAYCVIGASNIGERTQIASHVEILSGRHQHRRGASGEISGVIEENFIPVNIGQDCWIGARAIIMADVGARTTIGAGAVVTRSIPRCVVAVGNPARVLEREDRFVPLETAEHSMGG